MPSWGVQFSSGPQHPQRELGSRGAVRPNSGELSEGVGGASGRLTVFNTTTYQELLDCPEGGRGGWNFPFNAVSSFFFFVSCLICIQIHTTGGQILFPIDHERK